VVAILSSSFGAVIVAAGRWTADRRSDEDAGMAGTARKTAAELLVDARSLIERVDPGTAWAAAGAGEALIVDVRSDGERRRDGIVPGSLHIPRTVLEWRVDPESGWSNPRRRDGAAPDPAVRTRVVLEPRRGDARRPRLPGCG
jgi:hypothetical protein